jgi:hypothetical protein
VTATDPAVAVSDAGPSDELGALRNLGTVDAAALLSRARPDRIYDLGMDLFLGMPSFQGAGDPPFQIWMTHTPSACRLRSVRRCRPPADHG